MLGIFYHATEKATLRATAQKERTVSIACTVLQQEPGGQHNTDSLVIPQVILGGASQCHHSVNPLNSFLFISFFFWSIEKGRAMGGFCFAKSCPFWV